MNERFAGLSGCGCLLLALAINLLLGGIATHYVILMWFAKDIAFGWAALIGLFGGELTIPAAIITYLLHLAGVI